MNSKLDEDGWSPQGPVTELAEEHCWEFLQRSSVGRLAVSVQDRPAIFPVNFSCDGHTILFRTSAGAKLSDLQANEFVAFEADEHTSRQSLSVIVEGRAHQLTEAAEISVADRASLPMWIPVAVPVYVRITPISVRGRRFTHSLISTHAE